MPPDRDLPAWQIGHAMGVHGTPSAQIGRWLIVFKRSGAMEFARAWRCAWMRTRWPQPQKARHDWYRAAAWARPFFEAAWYDRPVPDMGALEFVEDAGHREVERKSEVVA